MNTARRRQQQQKGRLSGGSKWRSVRAEKLKNTAHPNHRYKDNEDDKKSINDINSSVTITRYRNSRFTRFVDKQQPSHNNHTRNKKKTFFYSKDISPLIYYNDKSNNFDAELCLIKKEYSLYYKPLYRRKLSSVSFFNKYDISMMQFNILADGLSGGIFGAKKVFKHIDEKENICLDFKFRGYRIIEEIIRFNPDIITIQEIDQINFFNHYLKEYQYKYVFQEKPNSPTRKIGKQCGLNNLYKDGSAIFYKMDKFNLLNQYKYTNIQQLGNIVCVAIHLQLKNNINKQFIVASMHLKAGKKKELKRMKQLSYIMPKLKKLSDLKGNIPVFIGCDLNAICRRKRNYFYPFCYQSIVNGNNLIEFIKNYNYDNKNKLKTIGIINDLIHRFGTNDKNDKNDKNTENQMMDKEICQYLLNGNNYKINYGLNLKSAYCDGLFVEQKNIGNRFGFNPIFTATLGGIKCLDYIFYEPSKKVQLTHLLSIPYQDGDNINFRIPNLQYPSDHFSVMACFNII